MVSLSLMARLVEAVRADARLVLVGDPGQLASIEAGVVLGDIVGGRPTRVVVLERVHRFGGGIARVAEAIRRGDGDATVAALQAAPDEVTWLSDGCARGRVGLELVRDRAVAAGLRGGTRGAGRRAALTHWRRSAASGSCAPTGAAPYGVSDWTSRVVRLARRRVPELDVEQRDYVGRPLLVTENDYELGLYNGDTGVIVTGRGDRPAAAFERGGELLRFSPLRLGAVETVYAMTIHKSQGSQFDTAAVLLPGAELADPDPRAALHGGHPRAAGADPGRHRGGRASRGGAAGRAGLGTRERLSAAGLA